MTIVNFIIYFMIMVGIYALLSMSLNFQVGYAGLINFGQVVFFCIGAYTSSLLATKTGLPLLFCFLSAMIVSGFFGYVMSIPTKSLKSDYWAIATLAAAEVIRLVALNEGWLTGGPFGVMSIPQPLQSLFSMENYPLFYLLLVAMCVVGVYFCLTLITDSPFGRDLKAIREEEDLCLSLGKNTRALKLQAMIVAGMVGGLAGALFAHYITYISPENFWPIETFLMWAMIIVGGRGNHAGAILGAALIQLFNVSTRFIGAYVALGSDSMASLRMIIIGLLIIIFVSYRPEGLIKEKKKVYHLRTSQEE
ncbi:MAG: branched-chain amino acid ABC transporter permease [Deltaproteobacteria bacterium]|nr:branched-chain amino acid ABC transporter permease [Deltaproteobacteria bacterium]MBW1929828.1 branched-chain amino acid ABC transporter permease [Deltaproteobacteria bacterium]MBW2024127.1 branched-chain amino acid ABC transporter permease [Deltaproteobacteria bacterium]MBW2124386.1 branched-chain amino acid ABC transporter permease [Deltaproteobacteria bacterium]RLB24407.1 MAG: branched-chain amino acid ABC transporter permease [Deltaproteobacteria bacterium]